MNISESTSTMGSKQFITTSAEVTPNGGLGILPQMAETFRLRIYNTLPRTDGHTISYIYIKIWFIIQLIANHL